MSKTLVNKMCIRDRIVTLHYHNIQLKKMLALSSHIYVLACINLKTCQMCERCVLNVGKELSKSYNGQLKTRVVGTLSQRDLCCCTYKWFLIRKVVLVVIITSRIITVAHHYRKIILISALKLLSSSSDRKKFSYLMMSWEAWKR